MHEQAPRADPDLAPIPTTAEVDGPGTSSRMRPGLLLGYALGVGVLGVLASVAVYVHDQPLSWLAAHPVPLVALALCLVVGELRPIPVSRGDDTIGPVTISTTFAVALIVLGPVSFLLLLHTVVVGIDDLRSGRRPLQVLFNAGQYALSLLAGRLVYCLLTGTPFLAGYTPFDAGSLLPALAGGLVFALVNDGLVAVVGALASGQPVRAMLLDDIRFKIETSGVLVALGPVAALLVDVSVLMLPLIVLPVLAVRRTAHLAALRESQSLHDPLTGLANRQLFRRRLDRALASGHGDPCVAVLMIDLDHFKDVNDTLGHHVGDELLREVGTRIDQVAREQGRGRHSRDVTVARLGGDEFAVLLVADRPHRAAVELADDLLARLAKPVDIKGQRLSIQGSIGITTSDGRVTDVHEMLSEADIALYEAKRERARYRVFEPGTVTGSAERLRLLPMLRDAVEQRGLDVVYQPQVDIKADRIVGFEALVRWDHPLEGQLGPEQFIDLAESAGLIASITTHVLDVSLAAARGWRDRGWDVGVSVNLSARQLSDLALPDHVGDLLRTHGVPASLLTIEVTESSLMADARQATTILRGLRDMGVRLAIDDFGTGYSSLVLLQRLDVDELKVDRSFVAGLARGGHDEILVRSIIELAHNLGLSVVAEGVETTAVAEHLRTMGCDLLQGYLIGRPMPEEAVTAVLGAQDGWGAPAPTVPLATTTGWRPLRAVGG